MLWRLRTICSLLLLALLCGVLLASVRADQVQLRDGRVIEAEEVWESGEFIWYRQGRVTASVAKADVKRIVTARQVGIEKSTPRVVTAPSDVKRNVITRLVLKSGTPIVVDEAQEFTGFIRYRLGAMQTMIERDAVERIEREIINGAKPVAPPRANARFTTGHAGLDQLILNSANKHSVDPLLIYLVMRQESSFNHRAVSRVGARGLMQLMPATARRFGVRNIHDPVENVEAGTRYLKELIDLYEGDLNLTLAAYNAGEHAIARYGRRVPPYRETIQYVRRIGTAYRQARDESAVEPAKEAASINSPQP